MAFHRDMNGRLPRYQSDEAAGLPPAGSTARDLAPSKEFFDTLLSPPDLSNEPGSATGRSDTYPDRTHTCELDAAFRTHHARTVKKPTDKSAPTDEVSDTSYRRPAAGVSSLSALRKENDRSRQHA